MKTVNDSNLNETRLVEKQEKSLCQVDEVTAEPVASVEYKVTTPLEEWVDGGYIMRQLGISLRTLQTWRSSGIIPYSQVLGKLFYKRSDIERLLDDHYRLGSYGKGKEVTHG